MRRPVNWLVVCSSAVLLLTAMKLPGGSASRGGDTGHHPPMVASEHWLTFAYLPRENPVPVAMPALLTITESGMTSDEPPPPLQFELLANPDL